MEARASAKFLRGSPQKARLVIDMIRGKNVNQALAILRYSNKRAALGIEKCVKSAIANANEAAEKANVSVDPDELWLKAAFVDRGLPRVVAVCAGAAGSSRSPARSLLSCDDSAFERSAGRAREKESAMTPAVSKKAKRGGAAAAPRAKHAPSKAETAEAAPEVSEAPNRSGAEETGAKKAAAKLGSALKGRRRRTKSREC